MLDAEGEAFHGAVITAAKLTFLVGKTAVHSDAQLSTYRAFIEAIDIGRQSAADGHRTTSNIVDDPVGIAFDASIKMI